MTSHEQAVFTWLDALVRGGIAAWLFFLVWMGASELRLVCRNWRARRRNRVFRREWGYPDGTKIHRSHRLDK